MANITENITFKRLRNKYRLVITNDDTFEEVVTFRLSRVSLYVALSSTFVLLVGLTICLLVFTPLKYYIPGYGNRKTLTQLQLLKIRTDSIDEALQAKEQYYNALQKTFKGDASLLLDTNTIAVDKPENDLNVNQPVEEKGKKKKRKKSSDDGEDKPRRRKHRR